MNCERMRFKCPVPITDIQNKKVRASFRRKNRATVACGIGEIMASTNSSGMSLVWIQFLDNINQQWVRLYLNETRILLLKSVNNPAYDFIIEPILEAGSAVDE